LSRSCLTLFLALAAGGAMGQDMPRSSPFLPPADSAAGTPAASKYQLGGMMTKGPDLMVSITRMSDRQSFWIPVGGTVGEITVLSCNSDRDEAIIRASGEQITLTLRKSVVPGGSGLASAGIVTAAGSTPVPTPPLPPPSGPPEVQEREARMLVTDLLDIGQQHRKAYEEAKRKADAEKKP
jgi:hypothetical protein